MIKVFRATDKFYESNGDLVLTASKAVIHKEDNGDFYLDIEAPLNNELSRSSVPSLLPKEYTQVEYIESSGTQYIDSLYTPNYNTKIYCKFAHNENSTDTPVFGCRGSSNSNQYVLWSHPIGFHANTSILFNNKSQSMINIANVNETVEFEYNNSGGYYGSFSWNWTTVSGSPNVNLIIFGLRNNTTIDGRKFKGKMWSFKIWENDVLVRNFIPCYRNSDNVVGMYDLVNNKFYTNSGTGTFTHGKVIITRNTILDYNDYLIPNNILVANTPQGEQAFRITNVEKNRRKIKIKANHVFYDSLNYLIEDSYVVDKNCNDALDHLNNATSDLSPFTTISNITDTDSYRCVRKSLYEAIQVVLERWGGHLVRNNWSIGIYNEIGQDNGVTIRYAKNLKEITATYNWDDVVTKLLPVGKDGILLNALDPEASLYITSATQYEIPYTKTVSFEQNDIVEDDYKDPETGELNETAYKQALINDLTAQAQLYVSENTLPKVNYTLSANVEKVSDVGDRVEVIDEKLGINIMTRIISYTYDCILEKYTELEFGNFTPKLSDLMSSITANTEQLIQEENSTLAVTLSNELNQATSQIWGALSNSYVIYEGDKILIVDRLPKETATNVIMINNGGIGFSNTGINGTFSSAWTIDNVLNMENINVINLTADLIKGGTLKLGSNLNQNGQIEVYDEANNLIAEINKGGLKMYGSDGSYVLMNNEVGFAGYDRNNEKIYWVDKDEFHMKKTVTEEEITLVNKMRIIPITITENGQIVNDGIGFVNVAGGGS